MISFIQQYFYWDAANVPYYLFIVAVAFCTMYAAVFFHEIGHLLYFRRIGNKKAKITFFYNNIGDWGWKAGQTKDYVPLTDKQYQSVMVSGLMLGLVPIVLASYVWFPYMMLIIPYAAGSWSDIKAYFDTVE